MCRRVERLPDTVDPQTRSRMMSAVRSRDTKPELEIRRGLHARGFRYRVNTAELPGKPDIVFRKYRAVILVHGCFWHGHDCPLFRLPDTRREFWAAKIARNRERDAEVLVALRKRDWRCLTVWECAMRGSGRRSPDVLVDGIANWLLTGDSTSEIRGAS